MNHASGSRKWTSRKIGERHALSMRRIVIRKDPKPERRKIRELSLTREIIAPEILDLEPDLATTRWVAYGYLSPLECTELFCGAYLKSYRHFFGKFYDASAVDDLAPVDPRLLRNDEREITCLWKARQAADKLGMPYSTYISAVMADANGHAGRKRVPRPNQMYGEKQIGVARKEWAKWESTRSLFEEDWDPRFFREDPQIDLPRRRALTMAIRRIRGPNSDVSLANLLNLGALTEPMARRIFHKRPGLVDDALRRVTSPATARPTSGLEKYIPACFGMREDITQSQCIQCPEVLRCSGARQVSDTLLIQKTGTTTPLDERRRTLARERKRNERRRKRIRRSSPEEASEAA